MTAVTNPLGEITTHVYDSAGNRTAEVNPLGQRTSYTYSAAGQVTVMENALGYRTTLTLDDMNRVLSEENPLGQRTSFTYDLTGQRTATEDALGQRSTQVYDSAGRLSATRGSLGSADQLHVRCSRSADGRRRIRWATRRPACTTRWASALAQQNALGYRTTRCTTRRDAPLGRLIHWTSAARWSMTARGA